MKILSDSADKVGNMIRQAGFESPPAGMMKRIMNQIEIATVGKIRNAEPIISFRGWVIIGLSAVSLLFISYFLLSINGGNVSDTLSNPMLALRKLSDIKVSFRFSFEIPKVILYGLTGILVWVGLDFMLDTVRWKKHAPK